MGIDIRSKVAERLLIAKLLLPTQMPSSVRSMPCPAGDVDDSDGVCPSGGREERTSPALPGFELER